MQVQSDNDDEQDVTETVADDNGGGHDLNTSLVSQRKQEIQTLVPVVYQPPSDDNIAKCIRDELLPQLNDISSTLTTRMEVDEVVQEKNLPSSIDSQQSILSVVNESRPLLDAQLPSAVYGHLDRQSISSEGNFNLITTPNESRDRFRARSYAIMACTDVSKEEVKSYILEQFGENKIEYICIVEDHSQPDGRQWLLIQVIFKERIDRRKPFLKDLVGDICNYNVTHSDLAWNEYMKRTEATPYEYKTFKSVKPLSRNESITLAASKLMISTSTQPVSVTTLDDKQQSSSVEQKRSATKRSLVADKESEKKRKIDDDIARNALALAEDGVDQAMEYIKQQLPSEFIRNPLWYDRRSSSAFSLLIVISSIFL